MIVFTISNWLKKIAFDWGILIGVWNRKAFGQSVESPHLPTRENPALFRSGINLCIVTQSPLFFNMSLMHLAPRTMQCFLKLKCRISPTRLCVWRMSLWSHLSITLWNPSTMYQRLNPQRMMHQRETALQHLVRPIWITKIRGSTFTYLLRKKTCWKSWSQRYIYIWYFPF